MELTWRRKKGLDPTLETCPVWLKGVTKSPEDLGPPSNRLPFPLQPPILESWDHQARDHPQLHLTLLDTASTQPRLGTWTLLFQLTSFSPTS